MAITVFKSTDFNSPFRCVIHTDGRLTFSLDAIDKYNLHNQWCASLERDDEDPEKQNFRMRLFNKFQPDAFRINGNGIYCYLNAGLLFDQLGYNYHGHYIFFIMVDLEATEEYKLIKLIYRVKRRTRFSSN